MKLHKETVSPNLLMILDKLMSSEVFRDFTLVGGTALSLQRGHRRSIDIDMFTDVEYPNMDRKEIKYFLESEFKIHKGTEALSENAMGYSIFLGDDIDFPIKLDLFYTDPFIYPKKEIEGIRLADPREIIAMKMLAVGGPIKRQKDFWDIHEMMSDYTLWEMIQWGLQRNPYSLSLEEIIAGFDAIDDIEESPEGIDTLRFGDFWELKVMDLKEEINQIKKDHDL